MYKKYMLNSVPCALEIPIGENPLHEFVACPKPNPFECYLKLEQFNLLCDYLEDMSAQDCYAVIRYFGLSGDTPENLVEIGEKIGRAGTTVRFYVINGLYELDVPFTRWMNHE